ncbi:MAG: hypothetical protein FJ121_13335 [Deltaproteobacteria bacterium]|nr:hypothetical protein [Deltaproteobacteria bacterium]
MSLGQGPTPVRAIREKCLTCAGSKGGVRKCTAEDCPLYPYRMGKNPHRTGVGGNPFLRGMCPSKTGPSE